MVTRENLRVSLVIKKADERPHIKELGMPALDRIVKELTQVKYLAQIVVGIDKANKREWEKARKFFRIAITRRVHQRSEDKFFC